MTDARGRPGVLLLAALCVAPAAAASALPPQEVSGLRWCPASTTCLQWDPVPAADAYTVVRGSASGFAGLGDPATDSAFAGRWPVTTTGDVLTGVPASGNFFWYLATASTGMETGPAGANSAGPRIVNWAGTACGDLAYLESFAGPEGSPWPAPWTAVGSVAASDLEGGRARERPTVSFYSLARLYAPLPVGETDVEVLFSLEFEDVATQGVGFYVRQNGGYLQQSAPHGQGYAVFVEGFRGSAIGVWKEQDGQEIALNIRFDPALNLQNGVRYRVRFRARQSGPAATSLQAKIWPEAAAEPLAWDVEFTDNTAVLQGVGGGLAVDSWSTISPNTPGAPTPADTFIDDVWVARLCPP